MGVTPKNDKDKMSLERFLYNHIPFSYGIWQIRRYGLVMPNPEIKKNMPPLFVAGLTKIYKAEIERSINYATDLMNRESWDP